MWIAQFLIISGAIIFIIVIVYMVGTLNLVNEKLQAWKIHRAASKKTEA